LEREREGKNREDKGKDRCFVEIASVWAEQPAFIATYEQPVRVHAETALHEMFFLSEIGTDEEFSKNRI
jgi:hypothetical protein